VAKVINSQCILMSKCGNFIESRIRPGSQQGGALLITKSPDELQAGSLPGSSLLTWIHRPGIPTRPVHHVRGDVHFKTLQRFVGHDYSREAAAFWPSGILAIIHCAALRSA
jgi:hypothetical protein